ncbi:hypothetical protein [Curtobacterium sp. 458]|uniref:hypothetical protein n=1 Tax=Curtobacterium sp. 458 TaxID=3050069 RepID=UPI0025B5F8B1|nr:hypothetical protein [Curtobacterium sp. 458]WJY01579.1 hypothetical protein QPJ90_07735 [Curtobacterium sp. 458]
MDALAGVTRRRSADALRSQASVMLVAANCECGCGSFAVSSPGAVPAVTMHDVPALVGNEPPIEVLPVVSGDGRLASVEMTYFLTEAHGIPEESSLTARWPD